LEFVGDMATDAVMLNNGAYIVADGRLLAKHTLSSEAQSGLLRDLAKCSTVSEIHYLDGETNNATPTVALCMLNVICRDHAIPFDVIRKYSDVTAITYENKSGAFVLPVGVSKRNAIVTLSEHWGILPYEVVVFGDDYNDIDMLSLPGVVSVAVANAIPEVKAVASHVCGDCDEDGVAKWLEENAL
jgi:hydroxymethylpyrimidine pyrophosphatase-like HAD family hydrolase